MNNHKKAEYIFQQLAEHGAKLPETAILCIETALNDLEIHTLLSRLTNDRQLPKSPKFSS
jgi:hypothetical protein